ncbi:MAG: serine hydrolase [Pseudomonadales bacterium]
MVPAPERSRLRFTLRLRSASSSIGCVLVLVLAWLLHPFPASADGPVFEDGDDLTALNSRRVPHKPADWAPLYQRVDKELQHKLDVEVASHRRWQQLVDQHRLGLCVVDLNSSPPRFARVNGNEMMYAASLPKIAILLGAYAAFEDGSLEEKPEYKDDLDQMIRVSSNDAATRMIDAVGMRKINATLRDPAFGLYDESRGGGLWVGKRYAKAGPRVGDPMHGISHGATPTQVCRFYYLLATGKLISSERSRQMLSHLQDPGLHHKFVAELDVLAPNARTYRKSGTWRDFHSDSVLVRGTEWRNYILVGLVQADDGGKLLREILRSIEGILQPTDWEGALPVSG